MKKGGTSVIGARDLVSIGVFGALSLLIFFVVGGIAGLTVVGTVANIPIVCFFTSIAYLLLAAKVRKTGTFLIMGTINVLPGLMAANVFGVIGSIAGWALAEVVATRIGYSNRKGLVVRLTSSVAHCSRRSTPFPYTFQLLSIFPSAKKYCDLPMRPWRSSSRCSRVPCTQEWSFLRWRRAWWEPLSR